MLDSLGNILPRAAHLFGDRVALVTDTRELGFRRLDDLSSALAHSLVGLGVAPGDRVTLYAPNCWEWIVSYYGVLKAGAIVNPVNAMLTPAEVAFVTRDCGAKALIGSPDKVAPALAAGVEGLTAITFGDQSVAGATPFEELVAKPAAFDPVRVAPSATSTIGYTSGTTGHPKGAMQSHRAVMTNVAMTAQMHLKTAGDVVVSALPCPHVYGNIVFQTAMLCGMKLVMHPRFDAGEMLAGIEAHRATLFEGVPTMYMYMLASPDLARRDLSSLTRCTVGGQTMPVAKMREVEERFGCPLIELWGMTEIAGLGATFPTYGRRKLGSIGIALPYCEARIADVVDAARTMPQGEVGELMIRGPVVMQGYWGNDKATRETIEPDGWLHSGDLASMDEDGAVFIVDRKKDMINTSGFKVFPAEIERVVAAHPSVAMVAVGGSPDDLKGEIARAYVVLRPGAAPDADGILALCRKELAAYKVPRDVRFVADLPKTSTGKIMRRELKTLEG
ncbi:long-chain acyl-CoA synthetase [Roseiarcus fermentans]|uniref:Long-chain acyl-CoA synthetase n=1 Tax=Roseiarcus fermentans TaxID=1473586 RepID=A0A366FSS7_9HYPH|nr:AMP-binding protein [Roseiarcus fermentans]RBP16769.1 long-chain acyl-CoA synthetase [Roseiarcus fermentans]